MNQIIEEYSELTWCEQYACHCSYLSGITSEKARCEMCEQTPYIKQVINNVR